MKAALFALAMLAAPVVASADTSSAPGQEKKVTVPEIDPTAITGPLVLLATGTLILTDRLGRKRPC